MFNVQWGLFKLPQRYLTDSQRQINHVIAVFCEVLLIEEGYAFVFLLYHGRVGRGGVTQLYSFGPFSGEGPGRVNTVWQNLLVPDADVRTLVSEGERLKHQFHTAVGDRLSGIYQHYLSVA